MKLLTTIVIIGIIFHVQAAADDRKLRIGFIGPLSGEAAAYGTACRNGMELARRDFGGDLISIHYEDDQFDSKKTVAAFRKLTERDKVDVIISVASGPSLAIAPLAEQRGVPLFAWASDETVSRGRPWVVRTYPSGYTEGAKAAEVAIDRGYQRVASFTSLDAYAGSVQKGLIGTLTSKRVVFSDEFSPTIADYRTALLRAASNGADSFFICLSPGQSAIFARQARQLNFKQPIFACVSIESQNEIAEAKGALTDAWFVTVDTLPQFRSRYIKEFQKSDMIAGAGIHYDLLRDLVLMSKSDPQSLIKQLFDGSSHDGVIGHYRYKDTKNDRYLDVPLFIKHVTASGIVLEGMPKPDEL